MKRLLLLLFFACLTIQSFSQEMKIYCFQKDAPVLFNLQTGAEKITEWIVIKGDSAAVISYMDKSCEQPWSFFEDNFQGHKEKNTVYAIKAVGDSITFTKVFQFNVKDSAIKQEYKYTARVYPDSLAVHIHYPPAENSPTSFNDLTGSPDRMYFLVPKK